MSMSTTLTPAPRPLAEVQAYLDDLLQATGLDASRNGLVVSGKAAVWKLGLAVNCSLQAIELAVERGCDLLVCHHPATRTTDAHLAEVKYAALKEREISLYVAHDCLDRARDLGTADSLGRAAQLVLNGPFAPDGEAPFGVHGVAPGRLKEFAARVGGRLGVEPRVWKNSDSFGHVAVVAGWGGRPEWIASAQALGCDTFLTGEALMFGLVFAREVGVNVVTAGHYATETPGVLALSARLARDLHLEVTFIPEEIVEARA